MQPRKLSGHPIIRRLLSSLPREIVDKASETVQSDRYYKTMDAWKQLVFMLYGVVDILLPVANQHFLEVLPFTVLF
ncbi:DUF4372 domain-containing protein [uncultured Algoriphagus sp.]|uniref:DUF4372 domain-containing protein n=1 Tax=uncultured Algoriphagus sp. TaxID=417365 RepID=UPI0030EE8C9D